MVSEDTNLISGSYVITRLHEIFGNISAISGNFSAVFKTGFK